MRRAGCLSSLIPIVILVFLFMTPPGLHLFFAATNWLGHLFAHQVMKSIHFTPTPSP